MNSAGELAFDDEEEMFEEYHSTSIRGRHQLEILKTLGEGTHGKVELAVEPATGRKFAVKTIPKKSLALKKGERKYNIQREIDIQSRLHHPNIISIYEVYESESDMTLVMEYASGGELYDFIDRYISKCHVQTFTPVDAGGLNEAEARRLFSQLVSAVDFLHQKGIVHRDLKLENILLDDKGCAKLADFGLSTTFGHGHLLKTYCGSLLYASPEIVNARPYVGPEVDCWSLGVMLFAMVYGLMPFDGVDFKTLRRQISNGEMQQPPVLSSAHDLILHILNPVLHKRAMLSDILRHSWLRDDHLTDSDSCLQSDSDVSVTAPAASMSDICDTTSSSSSSPLPDSSMVLPMLIVSDIDSCSAACSRSQEHGSSQNVERNYSASCSDGCSPAGAPSPAGCASSSTIPATDRFSDVCHTSVRDCDDSNKSLVEHEMEVPSDADVVVCASHQDQRHCGEGVNDLEQGCPLSCGAACSFSPGNTVETSYGAEPVDHLPRNFSADSLESSKGGGAFDSWRSDNGNESDCEEDDDDDVNNNSDDLTCVNSVIVDPPEDENGSSHYDIGDIDAVLNELSSEGDDDCPPVMRVDSVSDDSLEGDGD